MSKCALDIRKDIVGNVGKKLSKKGAFVDGDVGYFPNPNIASQTINTINKEFDSLVVKESDKGSFFIDPSDDLVNEYYEQYLMEQEALSMQAEDIERGGYTEEQRGEFFQVNSKEVEEASKQLDDYLLNFLKPFGVTSKEVDVLKNRLDEDSLGIADTINKLITISKNRKIDTVPEEAGHMLVMLMGENHPEVKALLNSIEKWSGYKEVYNEYFDKYYNEKQIKIEAIGKVLAKAFVKQYKENAKDSSIFTQARKLISSFFNFLNGLNPFYSNFYTYHLADKIAKNVLLGNTNYVADLIAPNPKLDYSKAVEENPLAKSIINTFTGQKFGFELTGSLAISGQGETIFRPENEPIHDLDFVVNDKSKREELVKYLESVNAVPAHYGIKGDDYTTVAYYIPKAGHTVEVTKREDTGWAKEMIIKDSSGKEIPMTDDNVVVVDFFIYNVPSKERTRGIFTSWQDIYKGKLSLSRLGSSERMFARPKDQRDYVLSVPVSRDVELSQFTYLQKEGMPSSVASEETLKKVKEVAKKMGVDIQDLATYARKTGLDITSVNGVTDLVRGVIAIANGKEDVALTEEMVHIATAILEQTNPALVTEMISKIDRFEIYKKTLKQYKDRKEYQLPDGKPNIRKIKKEAVDKLITELIVNGSEGSLEFPELSNEANRSFVRTLWQKVLDFIKGTYRAANIDVFSEAASAIMQGQVGGDVTLLDQEEIYFQLSDAQKSLQSKILETRDKVKKRVLEEKAVDPLLADSEEASNFYEVEKPDGTFERIKKRVTDRVKDWYNLRFRGKIFTEEEKKFNNFKRDLGIKGHGWFEEIHGRYFNSDGTKKSVPGRQVSTLNSTDQTMYNMLQNYYTDLIDSFSKDGKQPLVFSEVIVYDPKEKGGEAGTIDLLIVEESGKAHIMDWKFMSMGKDAQDVAWYKQGAYNVQLGRYKEILRTRYGIKEFGYNRAIPILMEFSKVQPNVEKSPLYLSGLNIGSVDTRKITDVRLIPVSEETESTGYESLDKLLKELNAVYKQISKKVATDEEERQFKLERLNVLKRAMRIAQGTMNLKDLVDVVRIMRKEGQNIIDDYNLIYKDRPATSKDSTNNELSDFSANMRDYLATAEVFSRVDDLIGDLIYKPEWEKMNLTEEQSEQLPGRKELLEKLMQETKQIRKSKEEIKKASQAFADKHIGERNLVTGLLKAEAILRGLGSTFRGVSELPLNSLKILFKLVTNAKGRAAQDALGEVNKLVELREKLAKRGGNLKELVQRIYQRDSKDKIVNKLIYKYSKEFFDKVKDLAATGGDKQWLLNNIDVEAYKEEAYKIMNERISRIENVYDENEELRDKLIKEEKQKWDITRTDFTGWDNYVIKRHPLTKWYSKEYLEMSKDQDLLDLYNFVSDINNKAKEVGYISNKISSTFLPFVRKTMAESLAWDFGTSAVANFSNALKINADDVGYGGINELTGELENSIPKYYTYDFTRGEDGVNDYSDISEDFFKNMILYINHMEKYKYLSEIEDQIALVKTVETFKNHLLTNRSGDIVYKGGNTEELRGNEENVKTFDDFTRALLYEQKYPLTTSDSPYNVGKAVNFMKKAVNKVAGKEVFTIDDNPSPTSLVKTIDAMNKAFQLKVLGFEPFSGLINAFGANIQLATQAGYYFNAREVLKNEMKLTGNRFANDEERDMFIQMIDTFMPLKDDPTYEKLKESGMTFLTRRNFSDMLMVFMREPEQHIEKSIFLTLLENMMVEDGKLIGIREYVKRKNKDRYNSAQQYREAKQQMDREVEELKRTRSIDAIKKLENGKLVIPGLDLTNREEIQRLTNLTRRISRNAMGSLSDGDINRMQMNIWTRSMMVFKNWIPKLVDTRFGEFRKVADDFSVEIGEDGLTTGEKYDIGRIRLWFYIIGTSVRDRTSNIYNILSVNDKGIEALDKMYDEFKEKFEKETGQDFTMDREEFFDLIRNNLRNQMKELAVLLTLMSSFFALGMAAPDDEEDRATKNRFRYYQRILDKAIGELTFFYNPAEFQKILTGAFLPSASLFSDISRFVDHTIMETTGIDTSNPRKTPEQVMKEAQPIKNAAKMFPFTKSLVTWMAIIDPEFAKEYDVTIQKQSRR